MLEEDYDQAGYIDLIGKVLKVALEDAFFAIERDDIKTYNHNKKCIEKWIDSMNLNTSFEYLFKTFSNFAKNSQNDVFGDN